VWSGHSCPLPLTSILLLPRFCVERALLPAAFDLDSALASFLY